MQCYGHPPCIDTYHWLAATYHLGLNGREGERERVCGWLSMIPEFQGGSKSECFQYIRITAHVQIPE